MYVKVGVGSDFQSKRFLKPYDQTDIVIFSIFRFLGIQISSFKKEKAENENSNFIV